MSFFFQPPIFAQQQQQQQQRQPLYLAYSTLNSLPPWSLQPLGILSRSANPIVALPVLPSPPPAIVVHHHHQQPAPNLFLIPPSTPLVIPFVGTACLPAVPSQGHIAATASPQAIPVRIIFYGHKEDKTPPQLFLHATDATYETYPAPPSRDTLLADLANWATHHGIKIHHQGGRINPSKTKLYILPWGSPTTTTTTTTATHSGSSNSSSSSSSSSVGLTILPDVGPVMPGNVIRVVPFHDVQETDLRCVLNEAREKAHRAIILVDMDPDEEGNSGSDVAPDLDPGHE